MIQSAVHNLLNFEDPGLGLSTFTEMIYQIFCQIPYTIGPPFQDLAANGPKLLLNIILWLKVSLFFVTPHILCS